MRFIKISDIRPVAQYLADTISRQLGLDHSVLWLVPGGSSIAIAAQVAKLLGGVDLTKLTVSLTDERYGVVGHDESNWHQLQRAGFVLPAALLLPVLQGESMATTTSEYGEQLRAALEDVDYALGFFGIGPDGHTAGILPNSPAVSATDYAASYDAGTFKRITMTVLAIAELDEAVVYAAGEAKWPVLDQLEQEKRPINEQPAQLLKSVPKLTIFNDYKGDTI